MIRETQLMEAVRHTINVETIEARRTKAVLSEAQQAWRRERLNALTSRSTPAEEVAQDNRAPSLPVPRAS
jgi:hypothetical protein